MEPSIIDTLLQDQDQVTKLGAAIGVAMGQAQSQQQPQSMHNSQVYKEATLGALPATSIYGRKSVFDACQNGDIFGLQIETSGFMQWIGARANKFHTRTVSFITWWGPEGTVAGTSGTGAIAPCDDPPGWEFGSCGYNMVHTSWYGRSGEPLDPHTVVQDRCETTPRYRLNGVRITDDVEWQLNGIMNVLSQSIRRDFIHGNHDNANEMDGLNQLVRTGYQDLNSAVACPQIDSIIVNWAHDDMDGVANGFGNFFDYLDEVINEIEWRANALGTINETDLVILTSRFMATCLLDSFACYTTCGVTSTSDITDQALRAQQRAERRSLNGGPLYDGARAVGYLHLKSGRRLPIIVEDVLDITYNGTNYISDIYLLTRRIGSQDVLYGEYLDMRIFENRLRAKDPTLRMRSDAVGRFITKAKEQNFCHQLILGTSPEIYLSAPWAQVRIQDVACSKQRQPVIGDPFQAAYLPGGQPTATASSPFYP